MPIPKRIYQTWKTKNLPWGIKNVIKNMKGVLESDNVPVLNKSCEKCMYFDAGKKLI